MCDRGKVVVSTNQLRFINFFLKVRSGVMLRNTLLSVCFQHSADDMPHASLGKQPCRSLLQLALRLEGELVPISMEQQCAQTSSTLTRSDWGAAMLAAHP